MDKLEKVELIREKTGVSYDDANAALAASNDDVLDAIIFLERVGKAQPQSASFTSTLNTAGRIKIFLRIENFLITAVVFNRNINRQHGK
jgi:translation elongation factor EF-Ts